MRRRGPAVDNLDRFSNQWTVPHELRRPLLSLQELSDGSVIVSHHAQRQPDIDQVADGAHIVPGPTHYTSLGGPDPLISSPAPEVRGLVSSRPQGSGDGHCPQVT